MNDHIDNITTVEDDDVMLPEGLGENDDIFADPATWTGSTGADKVNSGEAGREGGLGRVPAEAAEGQDSNTEVEADAPTTAQEEAPTTAPTEAQDVTDAQAEAAPTTEQQSQAAPNMLKFRAKFNSEEQDVELAETELPTVYQKALNHDRMQDKLNKAQNLVSRFDQLAKSMGYADAQDMSEKAAGAYREAEVKSLMDTGVPERVAKAVVDQEMNRTAAAPAQQPQQQTEQPARESGRNYQSEVLELLRERPDLQGKKLPDEVIRACALEGKRLPVAYAEYETRQEKAEAERLRQENAVLKQNAKNAARAPVKGAVGGGSTQTQPEDDFIKGFNSDY